MDGVSDDPRTRELAMDHADAAEAFAAAVLAFGETAALLHARAAETLGVTAGDLSAVHVIARHGPLTAGELGRRTGLASASMTAMIDRLEARRLVRRERDARDGRKVLVQVRTEGMRRLGRALATAGLDLGELAHEHPPHAVALAAALLDRLTARVRAALER